jgi:hypothetical protein
MAIAIIRSHNGGCPASFATREGEDEEEKNRRQEQ